MRGVNAAPEVPSEHLIASEEQGGLVHLMSFEAALNKRSSLRVEPNREHQRSDGRGARPEAGG